MAFAPDQAPEAVHVVALLEDQVNVELLPLSTELGFARMLTVGVGDFTETAADWAAVPPSPVQVRV
jgi:hypothetical protein